MTPELSRPFAVDRLGEGGAEEHIVASPAERAAVAKRLDLLALDRLEAWLSLRLAAGATLLEIGGRIEASVVQSCVITLEPVPAKLSLPVEITYALTRGGPEQPEESLDPDAPEPLPPGGLDLGEEVVQMLSLGLDPYPRAPGAALPEEPDSAPEHPFAKLRELKPRK
ncbi:MAG TPA: DUF177 domain-containing protein [Kiloniellales bacterium]|nr:DUF177 domain-containing protein [Kiloniellales bacterium]